MIDIKSIHDYNKYKNGIIEPLILPFLFNINKSVREQIISLFGKQSPQNDVNFYKWVWSLKPHWCENCGKPLKNYWAGNISHIQTKGAWTEYRYDPLNTNILCLNCHNNWEYSNEEKKKEMYVYWKNKQVYELFRSN